VRITVAEAIGLAGLEFVAARSEVTEPVDQRLRHHPRSTKRQRSFDGEDDHHDRHQQDGDHHPAAFEKQFQVGDGGRIRVGARCFILVGRLLVGGVFTFRRIGEHLVGEFIGQVGATVGPALAGGILRVGVFDEARRRQREPADQRKQPGEPDSKCVALSHFQS